jgi:hypothetical protein
MRGRGGTAAHVLLDAIGRGQIQIREVGVEYDEGCADDLRDQHFSAEGWLADLFESLEMRMQELESEKRRARTQPWRG